MAFVHYKNYLEPVSVFINENHRKLILLVFASALFFTFKTVFFLLAFFALDFMVSYIDLKYKIDMLFDFSPIGMIAFCYAISPNYSFLFAGMMLIPRIITGKLEKRHLIKVPILIIIGFLAGLFNFAPIAILGGILFTLRYIMEYALDFAMAGYIDTSRIPRRILHLAAAIFFFSSFGSVLVNVLI